MLKIHRNARNGRIPDFSSGTHQFLGFPCFFNTSLPVSGRPIENVPVDLCCTFDTNVAIFKNIIKSQPSRLVLYCTELNLRSIWSFNNLFCRFYWTEEIILDKYYFQCHRNRCPLRLGYKTSMLLDESSKMTSSAGGCIVGCVFSTVTAC